MFQNFIIGCETCEALFLLSILKAHSTLSKVFKCVDPITWNKFKTIQILQNWSH